MRSRDTYFISSELPAFISIYFHYDFHQPLKEVQQLNKSSTTLNYYFIYLFS